MMRSLITSAAAASVAISLYRAYQDAMANDVLIAVNEFVVLPDSDTQSFTDLSSTVEGEIRVETNTLSIYKYLLRLNAFFLEANITSPIGRDGRRRTAVEVPSNAVPLTEVVLNDIVEATALGARQPQITFTPGCTSHQTLLQYKTRMHEEFMAPVSIRDAVVQSIGPGQLRLSFVVIVHAAVLDLELVISLPKQARALTVNTDGVGSWKPSTSSDREILWYIGASGTGGSSYRNGETASLATVPTNVQEQQRKLFGSRSHARRARDADTQQSPERLIGDETVVLGNLEEYPHAELGSFMERIHFELVYSVNDEANEDTNSNNGGNHRKGKKSTRQHRREEVQSEYGSDVPAPGVGLSYAIAATVSSLTVKKLQIAEEKPTWDPSAHWLWRTVSMTLPKWIQTPKLCRKAQYTTRISQTASVEVQY